PLSSANHPRPPRPRLFPYTTLFRSKSKPSCTGCGEKEETQTLVQLNRSIERRGLGPKEVQGETLESLLGPCELHWKNNYTIDPEDRKSTRLNSSHVAISYAVFCLKK